MGEVIANTDIKKEKGFVYYVKPDEEGNLTICRAKAGRKKKD